MLVVNIIVLVLFLIVYAISLKKPMEWIKSIDKKEHRLYILYPMADLIMTGTRLDKLFEQKSDTIQSLQALYVSAKPKLEQRFFWCRRISMVIFISMLFNILSLLGQAGGKGASPIIDDRYLMRPGFGQGSSQVVLDVNLQKTEDAATKDGSATLRLEDVTIPVDERIYSPEEMEIVFEKVIPYLTKVVLSDNRVSSEIYGDLYFPSKIPDTNIKVRWDPEDTNVINRDGTVLNEDIVNEGVITKVTAILSCFQYQKVHTMTFKVLPRNYSVEEKLSRELSKAVSKASDLSKDKERLELPLSLENYSLSWKVREDNPGVTIFIVGILAALLVWFMGDKDLEKQMKKRKEQMLVDYPEIINKFTLLVNAGMTIKQAWYKIAEDYSSKQEQRQGKKHYAYEEMLRTVHELRLGLTESIAYEQYGRRIGLYPYIKFGSLLSQNLKKGNKGFTEILMKEARDAFEERKEVAKRLGEEAGTKLLMPMMIMLILVFLVILIPAFWSFQI